MIPLRDDNPTRSFPIVTVLLILANVAAYLYEHLIGGALFDAEFSMVPAKVTSGHDITGVVAFTQAGMPVIMHPAVIHLPLPGNEILLAHTPIPLWMTIFTSMFMHANLLHIGGNMLFLWIFGNNVEDAFGKVRYLLFYFFCGWVAAYAQIMADPSSLIPTLGASGAIAGVLGAYIVMYPDARVLTLIFLGFFITWWHIRAFWVLFIWIGLQVIEGVAGLGGMANGGVAYFAHIGGFFTGVILTLIFGGRSLGQRQRQGAQNSRYQF